MQLRCREKQGVTIIELFGRFDANSTAVFDQEAESIAGGEKSLVMDCESLEYISSAGLRSLLILAKKQEKQGRALVMAAVQSQVRLVLDTAGFSAFIPIFESVTEALQGLPEPGIMAPSLPENHLLPLSFCDEAFLVVLDDEEGNVRMFPNGITDYLLAGAVLIDLALRNKIEVDLEKVSLVDKEPVGHPALDPVLLLIAEKTESLDALSWLKEISARSEEVQANILANLIKLGLLREEKKRILWVLSQRKYPPVNNQEIKEVKIRLRDIICRHQIPDPRDALLISMIDAAQLMTEIMPKEEIPLHQERIDALLKLDLIGQDLSKSISLARREVSVAIMQACKYFPVEGIPGAL